MLHVNFFWPWVAPVRVNTGKGIPKLGWFRDLPVYATCISHFEMYLITNNNSQSQCRTDFHRSRLMFLLFCINFISRNLIANYRRWYLNGISLMSINYSVNCSAISNKLCSIQSNANTTIILNVSLEIPRNL